jgi:hypothetical protein
MVGANVIVIRVNIHNLLAVGHANKRDKMLLFIGFN